MTSLVSIRPMSNLKRHADCIDGSGNSDSRKGVKAANPRRVVLLLQVKKVTTGPVQIETMEATTATAGRENPKGRNLLLQAEAATATAIPGTGRAEAAIARVGRGRQRRSRNPRATATTDLGAEAGRTRRKTNVVDAGLFSTMRKENLSPAWQDMKRCTRHDIADSYCISEDAGGSHRELR